MPSKLLLIVYIPSPDGKSVRAVASNQSSDSKKLHVKGCVDFELYNLGTTEITLFGGVVIDPGGSWSPQKSTTLIFAEDIDLKWEGEFALTHVAGSVVTPAAGTITR